jgi:outer membrane protein assembly factor BamB
MKTRWLVVVAVGIGMASLATGADDWPQWRGPTRDNKVAKFTAPKAWPKALTEKWKVTVGIGDASPVLAGDKVYVFTRQGGDEVIRCLDAAKGTELWKDKYATRSATVPGGGHQGPRSTPAVADGKVCTLGVAGILSCLDAAKGKVVWRKDTKAYPGFYTASSPIILDGKCIAYLGGRRKGQVVAYDLASGDEKWKWSGEGPAYGSPVLMTVAGTKQLVTPTETGRGGGGFLVGIGAANGKLLWKTPYQSRYNSATPIIDGQTVIYSAQGGGTVALKIEKTEDGFKPKELWKKSQAAGIYNTPVLKDGLLYGLSSGAGGGRGRRGAGGGAGGGGGGGGGGRGRGGRGRGGMMGGPTNIFCMDAKTGNVLWTDKNPRGQCGAIFDAGSVLLALTSDSKLVVFKPSKKGFEEVAKYKVADTETWAYPIIVGNRVFVKDKDKVTLWTIE